jgi:glutaminase
VGQEASGKTSNAINLDTSGRPHNSMINSGGILTSSLYRKTETAAHRHENLLNDLKDMAGLDYGSHEFVKIAHF